MPRTIHFRQAMNCLAIRLVGLPCARRNDRLLHGRGQGGFNGTRMIARRLKGEKGEKGEKGSEREKAKYEERSTKSESISTRVFRTSYFALRTLKYEERKHQHTRISHFVLRTSYFEFYSLLPFSVSPQHLAGDRGNLAAQFAHIAFA